MSYIIKLCFAIFAVCVLVWLLKIDSEIKESRRWENAVGPYVSRHEGEVVRLKVLVDHLWRHQSDWEELLPEDEKLPVAPGRLPVAPGRPPVKLEFIPSPRRPWDVTTR